MKTFGVGLLGALVAAANVEVAIKDDGPLFEVEAYRASYLESAIDETQQHSALEAALLHLRRLNTGHYHRDTRYCDNKPCSGMANLNCTTGSTASTSLYYRQYSQH